MCIDVELLSAYLDGELEPQVSASVEAHLLSCTACRKRLEELKAVDSSIKGTKIPSDELDSKRAEILASIEGKYFKDAKVPFLRRRLSLSFGTLGGTAAAVFVLCGVLGFSGHGSGAAEDILPSYPSQADPSNIVYVSSRTALDSYSVEEIADYLRDKGYEVELSDRAQ